MQAGVGCISRAVEVAPAFASVVGTIAAVSFAAAGSCVRPVFDFLGAFDPFGAGAAYLLRYGVHLLRARPHQCNVYHMEEATLSWAVPCPSGEA